MVPNLFSSPRNKVLFPLLLAGSFLMMHYIVQADKAETVKVSRQGAVSMTRSVR